MIRSLLALAILAAPFAVQAQEATPSAPPERIRNVLLRPGEPCPKPTSPNEVVVCGSAEADPYRIPKQFRDAPRTTPESTAWGVKVDRVMDDNRRVLPGSCSAIGSNGATGCNQRQLEQWAAERRQQLNAAAPTGGDEPQE